MIFFLVQTPAAVSGIDISPFYHFANVTWTIPTTPQDSSYITEIIIYLNLKKYKIIPRGTQVNIFCLKPNTSYTVGIQTEDGSFQRSEIVTKFFTTKEEGKLILEYLLYNILSSANDKCVRQFLHRSPVRIPRNIYTPIPNIFFKITGSK